MFIARKLRRSRLSYFSLDVVDDWDNHLEQVSRWVKGIDIRWAPPEQPVYVMSSTARAGHMIDPAERFLEAVGRKSKQYGRAAAGVNLIVDCDTFPLQLIDVPEVLEAISKVEHPFREVWALSGSPGDQACFRIWPLAE